MDYAELQATSNFSFLRGGSHPQELVEQAVALGYSAIAITDRNSFAGIVRGHMAAKRLLKDEKPSIQFIPACEQAVLTLGGMGYAKQYHVERLMREVLVTRIGPITDQMILNFIGEKVLELPKSY